MNKEITDWFNNDEEQRMLNNEEDGDIDIEDCPRISSSRLRLPKITMSLAENQEDQRQLAVLLASKQTIATRFLEAYEEEAITGHPKYKTTTKCGIFPYINRQENNFRLQNVRESSLLRRRRDNRYLTESSEKRGPFEMDSSQIFHDLAPNPSPQTSPGKFRFEIVTSFEELVVIHSPRFREHSTKSLLD